MTVLRTLVDAGHTAYFAGGCVRDRLMGLEPQDYDVATDARPGDVVELFRHAHLVGEAFGVVIVRLEGRSVEVATFRADGKYSDFRHPDSVTFGNARQDAHRRDFTINGLFEDPIREEVIDYVDGRADIEARTIRAIGDPEARLREDQLRRLRAIRFAARLEFTIEEATAEAIRTDPGELRGVSRERIGQELRWMLTDSNRAVAAWTMQYLGVDEAVLRDGHGTVAPTRLGRLPVAVAYPTALAAWLLDRHAGGEAVPVTVARRWAEALVLSNAERRELARCLEIHEILEGPWARLGVAAQKRLAASSTFREALLVLRADAPGTFVTVQRRVAELAATGLAPTPLVSGDDLVDELGLKPGPVFRFVLDGVYDAQLEGSISTRAEALSLARAIVDSAPSQPT